MSTNMVNLAIHSLEVNKWVVSSLCMMALPVECLRVKADMVFFAGNTYLSALEAFVKTRYTHLRYLYLYQKDFLVCWQQLCLTDVSEFISDDLLLFRCSCHVVQLHDLWVFHIASVTFLPLCLHWSSASVCLLWLLSCCELQYCHLTFANRKQQSFSVIVFYCLSTLITN